MCVYGRSDRRPFNGQSVVFVGVDAALVAPPAHVAVFKSGGPTFWELADQALSSTDRGYEKLAAKFDYTPFRTPDVVLSPIGEFIANKQGTVATAIDLCTGTGAGLQMLKPIVTERLVGIDRVEGMVQQAQKTVAQPVDGVSIEFWVDDVLSAAFTPDFDIAVSFGAFGHILASDEAQFVHQVWRVLKPGGRFYFVTAENPGPRRLVWWLARGFNGAMRIRNALIKPAFIMYYLTFLLPQCRRLLEARGFVVHEHRGLWSEHWGERLVLVEAQKPIATG